MLSRCGSTSSSVEHRYSLKAGERAGESDRGWRVKAPKQEGTVELERDADGHFYADVEINGSTVKMLVDTGATGSRCRARMREAQGWQRRSG